MKINFLLIFAAFIVGTANSLKCFHCDPTVDIGQCGDPFKDNTTQVECKGEYVVCTKMVSRSAKNMSSMAVGRTCSDLGSQACNKARDRLSQLGNKLTFCKTCNTDFCNGVQHLDPFSSSFVLTLAISVFILKKL